jgi:hypothetical protein
VVTSQLRTFGQYTWAPWCYRFYGIGLTGSDRAETARGDQKARNPDTKQHQSSLIECDILDLPSPLPGLKAGRAYASSGPPDCNKQSTGLQQAGGISDRLACSTGQPIANPYDRINPSISDSAQVIAASIDLPDWVHMAIIFGIVACANIWVPIFSGAG